MSVSRRGLALVLGAALLVGSVVAVVWTYGNDNAVLVHGRAVDPQRPVVPLFAAVYPSRELDDALAETTNRQDGTFELRLRGERVEGLALYLAVYGEPDRCAVIPLPPLTRRGEQWVQADGEPLPPVVVRVEADHPSGCP
jgi:hypothetical protein